MLAVAFADDDALEDFVVDLVVVFFALFFVAVVAAGAGVLVAACVAAGAAAAGAAVVVLAEVLPAGAAAPPERPPEADEPNCGGVIAKTAPRLPKVPTPINKPRFAPIRLSLLSLLNQKINCLYRVELKGFVVESILRDARRLRRIAHRFHQWRRTTDIDIAISKGRHILHDVFRGHWMHGAWTH